MTRRAELRRRWRSNVLHLVFGVLLVASGAALAQPRADDAQASLALVAGAGPYVHEGAVLYSYHCAACHGDTGLGFEEARSVFPTSHQTCTRCHRPGNPRTMAPDVIREKNVFDLGIAPALLGDVTALDRFGSAAALRAYVASTMPRPFPGTLTEREYDQIIAFLAAAEEADGGTTEADAATTGDP